MLLKNCRYVLVNNEIVQDVDILIENGSIKEIGTISAHSNLKTIDCSQKVVLPGMINLHLHGGMNILRGIEDDMELDDWLNKKVWPAEKKLNKESIYYGTLASYIESLFSGTTTVVDAYFETESMMKAAENSHIRAYISPAVFSKADAEKIASNKFFSNVSNENLINPFVFIHSIYATQNNAIEEITQFCKKNNLIKAIHLSETRNEIIDNKTKTNKLPVNYLDEKKFFEEKALLVHCTWLTKDEIKILKNKPISIAHCPTSNMKLASGATLPLMECFENNINVGLGTDSVVSNNSLDMFSEMKQTGLVHKNHRWDATVANKDQIIKMPFENGAKALFRKDIGVINKGSKADIITLNLNDFNLIETDTHNLISNLIYSANRSNIQDVIVNGNLLIENKQLQFKLKDFNNKEISISQLKDKILKIRKEIINFV